MYNRINNLVLELVRLSMNQSTVHQGIRLTFLYHITNVKQHIVALEWMSCV